MASEQKADPDPSKLYGLTRTIKSEALKLEFLLDAERTLADVPETLRRQAMGHLAAIRRIASVAMEIL